MKKDFLKVLKVLDSCQNPTHIQVADKCFKNFYRKWYNKIPAYEYDVIEKLTSFYIIKKQSKSKILIQL